MEQSQNDIFDIIIWSGAALSFAGLLVILWCILRVSRAKRAQLDEEAMRATLKSILPINLGALFLSVLGLMMVGVGIALS